MMCIVLWDCMWFQIVPTRLKGARVWDESLSHVWLSVCEMRNSLNSNSHHEVVLRFVVSRNLLIKPSFATAGRGRSIPNIYSQCWHRTQVCCWKVTRIPNWNILIQYRICFQPKGIVIWHQPKRNALWFSGNPSKWPHILSLFERPQKRFPFPSTTAIHCDQKSISMKPLEMSPGHAGQVNRTVFTWAAKKQNLLFSITLVG